MDEDRIEDKLMDTEDDYQEEYIADSPEEQDKCGEWLAWGIKGRPLDFAARLIRMWVDNWDTSRALRKIYFDSSTEGAALRAYQWARMRELEFSQEGKEREDEGGER